MHVHSVAPLAPRADRSEQPPPQQPRTRREKSEAASPTAALPRDPHGYRTAKSRRSQYIAPSTHISNVCTLITFVHSKSWTGTSRLPGTPEFTGTLNSPRCPNYLNANGTEQSGPRASEHQAPHAGTSNLLTSIHNRPYTASSRARTPWVVGWVSGCFGGGG